MQVSISTNHNEALTTLSVPERAVPVLIACAPKGRDGFTTLRDLSASSLSVRRVPKDGLQAFLDDKRRALFENQYGAVPQRQRERLLYLLGLADAVSRRDVRAMRKAVETYVPDHEWLEPVWREIARSPLGELHSELNSGIRGTRFVVWWAERERRLAPGIYCKDVTSALFALALSTIGQPGGVGVCKRCHKPFIRLRTGPKQDYCSYKCRVAAGMVRYRARKKRTARKRR
jgi:hypothetical protein